MTGDLPDGSVGRRAFLGGVLGSSLAAALAGCVDRSGVVGSSVVHAEPRRVRGTRPTVVAFDPEETSVHVTGFMRYGSSSCNRVGLDQVAYDAGERHLEVALTSVDDQVLPFPVGCTADMAATWYRATVRFADELPGRVTVVEDGSGEESTTRTVVRSEQRELCTTDHPGGSNASQHAHWTCPERYVAAEDSTGVTTPDDED
jgi:hypothetical protein